MNSFAFPTSWALRRVLLILVFVLTGGNSAIAQVYKCKGADGKLQLSDRPCVGAKSTEVVPDKWGSVSAEDRAAAQQRAARMQQDADVIDTERASARQASTAISSSSASQPPPAATLSTDHVRDCVRNVERQLLKPDERERLVAACRTTPAPTSVAEQSSVDNCRREVDRQLLSGEEKARRMAQCSGAAVPEPTQQAKKPDVDKKTAAGGPVGALHCNDSGCSDSSGNWYKKKMNGNFAGPNGACYVRNGYMHCP